MKLVRRLLLAALVALALAGAAGAFPPGPTKTAAGDFPPGPYKTAGVIVHDSTPPDAMAGIIIHDSSETGA